jgi:dissimilatory sulfite reductase (desulfoviridin) alpha/beta subunit
MREQYTYNAGRSSDEGKFDYLGVHEQADGSRYVGINVAVGRMEAPEVIRLADLADEYGSGEIRLTRRQNPIIVDIDPDRVDELLRKPLLHKHKPEPNPFVRGAMACTGTEFCSLALAETKTRMAAMLRWLRDNVDLPDDVDQLKIHFSGCTADCGQANTADIGLFVINFETSLSSGIRRIEAQTSVSAFEYLKDRSETLAQVERSLSSKGEAIIEKVDSLQNEVKSKSKEIAALKD